MKPARIEQLTWVLIFGGVLALILGWFLTPQQGPWGELLIGGGFVTVAVGLVLIVVRSRMSDR